MEEKFYWQQCKLLKSYLQLVRLEKKRKNYSFKTLFVNSCWFKSTQVSLERVNLTKKNYSN